MNIQVAVEKNTQAFPLGQVIDTYLSWDKMYIFHPVSFVQQQAYPAPNVNNSLTSIDASNCIFLYCKSSELVNAVCLILARPKGERKSSKKSSAIFTDLVW